MNEQLVLEARNKSGDYFRQGYNCAESIFLAFRDLVIPDVDPALVRMMTGFGGGLGHSGCMCGALTGAAVVLGALRGRVSADQDREVAYGLTSGFHDRFEAQFGSTCCRAINPYTFDTPEHLKNCLKVTGNTGKMLMEYIQSQGLVPDQE